MDSPPLLAVDSDPPETLKFGLGTHFVVRAQTSLVPLARFCLFLDFFEGWYVIALLCRLGEPPGLIGPVPESPQAQIYALLGGHLDTLSGRSSDEESIPQVGYKA